MGNYFEFLQKGKHINQRQYDLSNILLNSPSDTEIGVFDLLTTSLYSVLYRGRTERTAQIDVKNLVKFNVLKKAENGKYVLNPGVLDAR